MENAGKFAVDFYCAESERLFIEYLHARKRYSISEFVKEEYHNKDIVTIRVYGVEEDDIFNLSGEELFEKFGFSRESYIFHKIPRQKTRKSLKKNI